MSHKEKESIGALQRRFLAVVGSALVSMVVMRCCWRRKLERSEVPYGSTVGILGFGIRRMSGTSALGCRKMAWIERYRGGWGTGGGNAGA